MNNEVLKHSHDPETTQNDLGYRGKRVVVTGCASGIGHETASSLLKLGAEVIGIDVNPTDLKLSKFLQADLSSRESIEATAKKIDGPIDVLFNIAGITGNRPPASIVQTNYVGTRELTDALLSKMGASAAIVNTASLAASGYAERLELLTPLLESKTREEAAVWLDSHLNELGTGYAISKDAIVWHTKQLALRLASAGIRVNAIAPGITQTPMLEDTIKSRGADFLDGIPRPLGRVATAKEQAGPLLFLGSELASYMTGQVIWVDGGYMTALELGEIENVSSSTGKA